MGFLLPNLIAAVPRIAGVGSHIASIEGMTPSDGSLIGQVRLSL